MVVLNKFQVDTKFIPHRFVIDFREETSSIAMLIRRYHLDCWYLRLFYLHRAPRWHKEVRTPLRRGALARPPPNPAPQIQENVTQRARAKLQKMTANRLERLDHGAEGAAQASET